MPTQNRINAGTPISVSNGGTGVSSTTAYGVLCGGTTATGPIQNVGTGTSGQFLISNGANILPSFQDSTDLVWLQSVTINAGDAQVVFTSLSNTYTTYYFVAEDVLISGNNINIYCQFSSNNGVSYIATGYNSGVGYANFNSTTIVTVAQSTTFAYYAGLTYGSGSRPGLGCVAVINNIGSGTPISIKFHQNNDQFRGPASGTLNSTSTINAIRIYPQSGTFSAGKFHVYGQKS